MEQFSLTPSSSGVVTGGRVCPQGPVTFTCTGSNLNRTSIYWYLNGDQISSFTISNSTSLPQRVNTTKSGISVTVISAQTGADTIASVRTTLTMVLSDYWPNTIACGSRQAKNTTTIACDMVPIGKQIGR